MPFTASHARALSVLLLGLSACSPQEPVPPRNFLPDGATSSPDAGAASQPRGPAEAGTSRATVLGYFEGRVDPVLGTFELRLIPAPAGPEDAGATEVASGGSAGSERGGFAVREQGLCDETDYITVQDGAPGSGPPDSIEVQTLSGSLLQDLGCNPLWNPLFDPPLFCADVTVRSFYTALVLEGVHAEILSMSDTNHLGYATDPEPDPGNPPSDAWGLWSYGDIDVVGNAPANAVTRTWIFERNNDTFYSFQGRIVGAAAETCDGLDNNCDGSIDEGVTSALYLDNDGDEWGALYDHDFCASSCVVHGDCPSGLCLLGTCSEVGYSPWNGDCDDAQAAANPGATEICDGSDNDCDSLVDEGGVCLAPTMTTDGVAAITQTQAQMFGTVVSLGVPPPVSDRGICYSSTDNTPELAEVGVTCVAFGPTGVPGGYSVTESGLTEGTQYWFQAYGTNLSGTGYGGVNSFVTVPADPTNASATDGTLAGYVEVTWDAMPGATGYDVYRDGLLVGPGVVATSWDDLAAVPGAPNAPAAPTATDGSLFDRVRVTWTPATVPAGSVYSYTVRAKNASGTSGDSAPDNGNSGPLPVTSYEVSIDGGSWFDVGMTPPFDDMTAPAGTISPGTASASDGTAVAYVSLNLAGAATVSGASRSYRVRGVNGTGSGSTSPSDGGYRGVGGLAYRWRRSAGDADGGYTDIAGTTLSYNDTGAPADGSGRYYVCVLTASGAIAQSSTSDRGYRGVPGDILSLRGGRKHYCGIQPGGGVTCWGLNTSGQVGDGSTTSRSTPITVSGITNAIAVSVGYDQSCALLVDGTVKCWGSNNQGQIGDGTTTNRLTPVVVPGLSNVVQLSGGQWHTCAVLADGSAKCWGDNVYGQLGDGTTTDRLTPTTVSSLSNVVEIYGGDRHTCARLGDGTARCWGSNSYGQVGDGTFTQRNVPTVVSGLSNVQTVRSHGFHSCALMGDGTARCWGRNNYGQLGDGTLMDRNTSVAVSGLSDLASVQPGLWHTCAVTAGGIAWCWGENGYGQLGDGTTTTRSSPLAVLGLSNVVEIAGAEPSTCARSADGNATCWGSGTYGEMGDGTTSDRTAPTVAALTPSVATAAVDIAGGYSHGCALLSDGTVRCWGANAYGQLGDGTTTARSTPTAVPGLTDVVSITAGSNHTCIRRSDGTLWCWGLNSEGELGDGTTTNRTSPVNVTGLSPTAVRVAGGEGQTCAVLANGVAYCWGQGDYGQLGYGGTADSYVPVSVTGLTNVSRITGGNRHTCALLTDGTGRCWGANSYGQLGNGSTTTSLTAVTVTGLSSAVELISDCSNFACVRRTDSTLRCWGYGPEGNLGNGSGTSSTTPVTVSGLTTARSVSLSITHAFAVMLDGTGRAWGANAMGQLGDGSTTQRNSPVTVTGYTSILELDGAWQTSWMRRLGGNYGWGYNGAGQVGDGTTTDRTSPVSIGGL